MENKEELKEKILKSLKQKRKFMIRWGETLWYEKEVEAVGREDAEKMFNDGCIGVDGGDVTDSSFVDGSLEVEEI